jgi:hypothetical protein
MGDIPHRLDHEGNKIPRVAIMGEFSAGKSTLCNLLMNGDTLPRKVTATQLAPVWMTKGQGGHARVQLDGTETPVSLDALASVPLDDTLYIRLGLPQDIFEFCDLIDFPGISDPNMDPDVWERLLEEADVVIWLTHATQAWRQTEAAVWDLVPEEVQKRSMLLLTRWDKIIEQNDRTRILRRLENETMDLFSAILPISLLDAMNAGDDVDAWTASGAEAFMTRLTDVIGDIKNGTTTPVAVAGTEASAPTAPQAAPTLVSISDVGPDAAAVSQAASEADANRVVPRRVRATGNARRNPGTDLESA